MKSYDTLSEAVNDILRRGYTFDFNLKPKCLEYVSLELEIQLEDFEIDETHRFNGMGSTDDNSVFYAISSKNGDKGLLVDAYGVYAENNSETKRRKLR